MFFFFVIYLPTGKSISKIGPMQVVSLFSHLTLLLQVIVGSFVVDGHKGSKAFNQIEPLSATPNLNPGSGATGPNSPQSRRTLSESSGGSGSPLNQSTGAFNNSNFQGMSSMPWK